jgi:hypothetical protein
VVADGVKRTKKSRVAESLFNMSLNGAGNARIISNKRETTA